MADVQTDLLTATEPPPPSRSRELAGLTWRLVMVAGWVVVAGGLWLTLSRALAITKPVLTVAGQAVTPLVYLAVWPVVAVAAWRRRWLLTGVAACLVVVHVVVVLPAVWPHGTPSWAATAPRVRLLSANVKIDNPTPDAAVDAVLAADADIVVLEEVTPELVRRIEQHGGYDRYPYRLEQPERWDGRGVAIYSKLAFTRLDPIALGDRDAPGARIGLPGGAHLDVYAVHTIAPYESRRADIWVRNLHALADAAPRLPRPFVLAGDFNATRWHPPFADLLGAGVHDAHEETGHGLSFSWPADRSVPPFFRLDHALTSDGVTATGLHDLGVPGSDHRGFEVELAVRPV